MGATRCTRCGATFQPRGGKPARYCPVCGYPLATAAQSHQAVLPARAVTVGVPRPHTSHRSGGPVDAWAVFSMLLGVVGLALPSLALVAVLFGILGLLSISNSRTPKRGGGLAFSGLALGLTGLLARLPLILI